MYSVRTNVDARTLARTKGRSWSWAVAFVAWVIIAVVAIALGEAYVSQYRKERIRDATELSAVAAEALEQSLLRSVEAMESIQSLMQTRVNLERAGDRAGAVAIGDHLRGIAREEKFGVLQLAVIKADGWLQWSTVDFSEPVWLGDREHYLVHRDGEKGMSISKPLIGRASGRWSVQFTRPLVNEKGEFDGVIVVSFDPLKLSKTLADLRFGENSVSAVLSIPHGRLIARSADAENQLRRPANPDLPALRAAKISPSGTIFANSAVDDRPMIMSYRVIGNLPLLVLIGLDESAELEDAASFATWVHATILATLLSAAALFAFFAQRSARMRSRLELELTRQDAVAADMARTQIARLLSGLPAAVYRMNLSVAGDVLAFQITDSAARLTGYDMRELATRKAWMEKVDGMDAAAWTTYFQNVVYEGEASVEYHFRHRDGTTLWFRDQARVLETDPGGEVSIVGYVSDITRERTIQAQAFAASKLATLGEMATGLAHELNQPIAIMSLAAENAGQMLERKGADGIKFAVQRMARIAEQATRARTIVNHLRIFGRQNDEGLGPINLHEIVDGALALVGSALRGAGVTVGIRMVGDLPPVIGQLVLAEHVVVNLMLNARDAMENNPPDRPRHLTISATHNPATGTVTLALQDSGPGIKPDLLDRVFEPFFTTKEVGKGTGLGLSICHGIMRSFGGNILAFNAPEGGAVLSAVFRQADEDDKAEPNDQQGQPDMTPAAENRSIA